MKNLSLMAIALMASFAHAELKVEWLLTNAEIVHEYCRTTNPTDPDCVIPSSGEAAKIHMPDNVHAAVVKHLEAALAVRYYDSLSPADLFHGHLILRGPQVNYASPEEFGQDVNVILYHSAEYTHRWYEESKLNIEIVNRRVRSFVGTLTSPLVQPAIDIVGAENAGKIYLLAGTIFADELIAAQPEISAHNWGTHGTEPKLKINVCKAGKCRQCNASPQLLLQPSARGGLETYIRCEFVSAGQPLSHRFVRRPAPLVSSL